jgi:Leucine-rich repeat (LRR) protein
MLYSSLRILRLNSNQIKTLNMKTFAGLTNLIELYLENGFKRIYDHSFKELINLEKLYIGRNSLFIVYPNTFSGLKNLKYLSILNNQLKILHSNSFKSMMKLDTIDASNNQISFIQKDEFRSMTSLSLIDLRRNKLQNLYANIVQGCINLKKFCLYGNLFPQNFSLNYDGIQN